MHQVGSGGLETGDVILRTCETDVGRGVDVLSHVVGVGVLHAVVQVTPVAVGRRRIPAQGEGVRSGVRGQSDVGGTGGTF